MTQLPRAGWTDRADLARLVAALGADKLRWVGGCVRDTLLELPVNDVDAATTLAPEAVVAACADAGIRTVPTGLEHGTVTAVQDEGTVEITTLRKDVSTDGRRATIRFAQNWQEDAARRDFTINALYAHPETLEVSDFFGGLTDLAARRVRFIGDARTRIREDHLRILRYYRFQARFGAALDEEAEDACADLADTLKGLSRERVAGELLALLALPDPVSTVERMAERGVLPVILPEATARQLRGLHALVGHERDTGVPPDGLRRLGALLPALPDVAEAVAARLRLSRAQRDRLGCMAARAADDTAQPRALAYRVGMECARDRLLLAGTPVEPLAGWRPPVLPLKGGAIVARGIAAGPQVARILKAVEARWVAEGFPDAGRVAALMEEEVAPFIEDSA